MWRDGCVHDLDCKGLRKMAEQEDLSSPHPSLQLDITHTQVHKLERNVKTGRTNSTTKQREGAASERLERLERSERGREAAPGGRELQAQKGQRNGPSRQGGHTGNAYPRDVWF